MSYYISRFKNVDLKSKGSKNLGASNTVALIGWKAGALVFIHDFGKAILAVCVSRMLFPELPYVGEIAGVSSVLGHIFPFYLKFKGGKGFATFLGMAFILDWKFALGLIVVVLLILFITDYIVLGTFTSIAVVPVYFGIISQDFIVASIFAVASIVILIKHQENIVRLRNGTEVGLRSANRGEHRVK